MRVQRSHRKIKPSVAIRFPSLAERQNLNQNVYMLTEDISLDVMPIGGRTEKQKEFEVNLKGKKSEREKAKTTIAQLCEHRGYHISEILCDAVKYVARNLTSGGRAVYEIIQDDEETHIRGFTSRNLFRIFSWYLQVIPPGDRVLWKRKYTLIHKKRIWDVQIPRRLGGKIGYRKMMRKLGKYQYMGPKFFETDLQHGKISRDYNFLRYTKNSEIYANRVTNKWGWNRRDYSQDNSTEFYMFYKILKFRWAQAILREHIISEINQLLDRLSINCEIIVTGLPTADEILQVRSDMKNGVINFSEALGKVEV